MKLHTLLLYLSLALFALTRFYALEDFPIFFFTDEAVHGNLADQFIQNNFRDSNSHLFPVFFPIDAGYNINSTTVYLHTLFQLFFAKSIFLSRTITVILALISTLTISYVLQRVFALRFYWAFALVIGQIPIWFYHSRTAFEYAALVSLYGFFWCFITLWLHTHHRKYILPTILSAALIFYTHPLGQILVAVTTSLVFISNFRFFITNPKQTLLSLTLAGIFLIPFIQFVRTQPQLYQEMARRRDSYLTENTSITTKIRNFLTEYSTGISPYYWFTPHNQDLSRHTVKSYGHLGFVTAPLLLIGVIVCLQQLASPKYRNLLIFLFVSPFPASLVHSTALRALWIVIPVSIISMIGLEKLLSKLPLTRAIAIFVLFSLGIINFYLFKDSLANGPTWYNDYGLYGMQYGAKQLFTQAIPQFLSQYPNSQILLTPSWANGTEHQMSFLLPSRYEYQVKLESIEYFLNKKQEITPDTILVALQSEIDTHKTNPKISISPSLLTINYPNGTPGFVFVKIRYTDQADQLFDQEEQLRISPVKSSYVLGTSTMEVTHSKFDSGELSHLFDNDPHTLVRTHDLNPANFTFSFPNPTSITDIIINNGFSNIQLNLTAITSDGPTNFSQSYSNLPQDPQITLPLFSSPRQVSQIQLQLTDTHSPASAKLHIRDIIFVSTSP